MLENATRICEAKFGSCLSMRGVFRHVALHNVPPSVCRPNAECSDSPPPAGTPLDRLARTKRPVAGRRHRTDLAYDLAYRSSCVGCHVGGALPAREVCFVPMLKDDRIDRGDRYLPPGGASVHRQADRVSRELRQQAVIAIENTRLLNRTAGVVGAADGHLGSSWGDLSFTRRT